MEGVVRMFEPDASLWSGKRIGLTGHTGFKGSWLAVWLASMGADVHGYALEPPTTPSLFHVVNLKALLGSSTIGDVRDATAVERWMREVAPDAIFHLAAQSLVRESYLRAAETYAVNVMGVVHVLDAVRETPSVRAVVNVTTDKCYENYEWHWGYRENEPMGGHDPYSSSKGCAELVTAAYRRSFLAPREVAVATARAGNVIGGGDWAAHRLVPDVLRALDAGTTLTIRAPHAVRPWQHVLEPLCGYLAVAEGLLKENGAQWAEAWNFGPADDDSRSVLWILERLKQRHVDMRWEIDTADQPHEATFLKLDSSKARARLHWRPRWSAAVALDKTLDWHAAWRHGDDMRQVTIHQISEYLSASAPAESHGAL